MSLSIDRSDFPPWNNNLPSTVWCGCFINLPFVIIKAVWFWLGLRKPGTNWHKTLNLWIFSQIYIMFTNYTSNLSWLQVSSTSGIRQDSMLYNLKILISNSFNKYLITSGCFTHPGVIWEKLVWSHLWIALAGIRQVLSHLWAALGGITRCQVAQCINRAISMPIIEISY